MEQGRFEEQFQDFNRWKDNLAAGLETYAKWLARHDFGTTENRRAVREGLELLHSDQLTVAFVAEFSRGKSELINALFFAGYGRRVLPSAAGRTTMCPTELFYDRKLKRPYLRLLPIETRLVDRTIADLKSDPGQWTEIDLDVGSPDQLQEAFQQLAQVNAVTPEEAKKLGLWNPALHLHSGSARGENPEFVEVPRWRHALVSFPHALLKQGLVLLDTPGLNALGSEPELTLNMLPKAQAVVFVLGADTGVTRSDLEIWQHHIKGFSNGCRHGLVVVLNKIDTMWDELKSEAEVTANIASQGRAAAAILGIGEECVFPVSAQKALIGKIKHDPRMVRKSRLGELDDFLSRNVMAMRREIIAQAIQQELDHSLENTFSLLSSRQGDLQRRRQDLDSVSGEHRDELRALMERAREEQAEYLKHVESFQGSRRVITKQMKLMLDVLDLEHIDQLIEQGRREMLDRWTTIGLKASMWGLFERFSGLMKEAEEQNEQTRRLVTVVYRKFQEKYGIQAAAPRLFRVMQYSAELERLGEEAESFRRSPAAALSGQAALVDQYFTMIVERARDVFHRAHEDANSWAAEVMDPLVERIRQQKRSMEGRLESLKEVSRSRQGMEGQLQVLSDEQQACQQLVVGLEAIRDRLLDEFGNGQGAGAPARSAVS